MSSETAPTPAASSEPAPAVKEANVVEPEAPETKSPSPTAPVAADKAGSDTPLSILFTELTSIVKEADHEEMWGVTLKNSSDVPTSIVLEKFLRANAGDVTKAKTQLTEALKWRKRVNPTKLLTETDFDNAKFGDLGYVTVYTNPDKHDKEIVTWNIYGGVKDIKNTFGNVEE